MRPIWSGSISFGLVNIPIKLYSAVETKQISFDLLHKSDMSRIRYARICKKEGKEVPFEELVKGYNYYDDQYVVMDDEDFEKIDIKRSNTLEIINFCQIEEIPRIYFEKPYYVEAAKGAEKSYQLLKEAMEKSGKVGVAKLVLRNKDHLVTVMPMGKVIAVEDMYFADEVRETDGLKTTEKEKARTEELDLAQMLIDKITKPFDINNYPDVYSTELEKALVAKSRGQKIQPAGEAPQPTNIEDLMSKLKESLRERA